MARRDDALGVTGVETMIGAGVVMEGTLASEGDIAIDGTFTGTVEAQGDVTLGVNATVTGNVSARNVTVAGKLQGDIKTEGEAAIRNSGTVHGDIASSSLAVESGATFVGRSNMTTTHRLQHPSQPDDTE